MTDLLQRYHQLLQPSAALVADMVKLTGDILILGAGGKMGPALATLAKQAVDASGKPRKVIAVSRFTDEAARDSLNVIGVETISADLQNEQDLNNLPLAENVLYLAGTKFGTKGREWATWAMNAYLPGRVAEKYRHSRIVVFSSGNIYPFTPVADGGADEAIAAQPVGEYAQSVLGRERIFQHFSYQYNTPILIYRLNYANDVSYGVLLEIAKAVNVGQPVNLAMGNVNVIWQGDANDMALRSLLHCSTPPKLLNITGPETVSVKWAATQFAKLLHKPVSFTGEPHSTALLNNAAASFGLFGYPQVTLTQMMQLIADWLLQGGATINKETHFQEREGQY